MRKIRIAQIGINYLSHAVHIFDTLKWNPDVFEVVGYCLVEDERSLGESKLKHMAGYPELTLEENAFLREFLSLKESHNDYRFLKCEIVASDASAGYRRTLTLNAGTVEGAAIGYPVITPSGVVGRITEVGGNWAKAAPITELSSAIGAYVERSGDSGVAEGSYLYRDAGQLLFNYLEEDADIIIGDRIRTSGVNSYYPRGLLIGVITEILTDPATGARSAVITPTSPLSDLRDVMVLTDFAIYETEPGQIPSDGAETESITDTP